MTLLLLGIAVGLALAMSVAWAISVRTGQSGWVDAIWSFATGAAGVIAALVGDAPSVRQWLVAILAALWGLRLASHIAARTRKGGDDPRYAQLKAEWGDNFRSRLFLFLQIQAACSFILVLSILVAARNPTPLGLTDALGVLVMVAAILGEAVADRQLAAFRADPANRGRVCDAGLWDLSRHPNYFFEWLGWVAYALIAIGYGWGWIALAGPVLMYGLLAHVSGVPPLEAHMLRSRGEAFRRYQSRVNAFWPGPNHRERHP